MVLAYCPWRLSISSVSLLAPLPLFHRPTMLTLALNLDEYYFGGSDRDVERQAVFASMFQQRCEFNIGQPVSSEKVTEADLLVALLCRRWGWSLGARPDPLDVVVQP